MKCVTTYFKSGINQMWILKNSKELLPNLKAQNFSQINSIKMYNFSTIPHEKLKFRLVDIIDNFFSNKNGKRKYSYLVISHQKLLFVKYPFQSSNLRIFTYISSGK
jgi:hypothetical protein